MNVPHLGDEDGGRWIMVWEPDQKELLTAARKVATRGGLGLGFRYRRARLQKALTHFTPEGAPSR